MSDEATSRSAIRYRLFDPDELPWTSSLSWYWLYIITVLTGLAFALLLGIYLGLWLKNKRKGASVLLMYLGITALAILLFFVPSHSQNAIDVISGGLVILWFASAYLLRREVIGYYSQREGVQFKINPVLAGFFPVWYINGCLRAEFPLNETGKTSDGILKLTV